MPDPTAIAHALRRADYRHFLAIPTRWMDNDNYGHVNNVTYYSYFDTVVNEHLIRFGGLDPANDTVVGYVVETTCRYRKTLSFPETVEAGIFVVRLGSSSVTYEVGLFRRDDDEAAATGRFVHVWVDRGTQRPAPIPARVRAALEPLVVAWRE
ncbi:MAG: thioesterase family protein [Betaproteobacteria bacterium]